MLGGGQLAFLIGDKRGLHKGDSSWLTVWGCPAHPDRERMVAGSCWPPSVSGQEAKRDGGSLLFPCYAPSLGPKPRLSALGWDF